MRRIKTIHFIGIGGVGMSGIAEVLANLGYTVTGSDVQKSSATERLTNLGIEIAYSHIAENVATCDAVVVSSAISAHNVELETARMRRIPIVPRAEMLAELMRFKQGIAVAGTHGKTTTTSLIATIFAQAKLDPTFVVGGKVNSFGFNAKLGQGKYFIAEADESDASFLHLSPMISVVTNIDRDHMETYADDFNKLTDTFLEFVHRIPFYGLAVLCIDDPAVRNMLPRISRPYITYGFSPDADIRASNWQINGRHTNFTVQIPGVDEPIDMQVNLSGKHNVLNSLAAIAVALDANISLQCIKDSLMHFKGVGRRFEVLGEFDIEGKKIILMDDYGHHPSEVQAVIDAIRGSWPGQRLVMIYQPHRYSRTKALFEDFATTLSGVDVLLMLEVYSAGEEAIPGIDSRALCGNIRQRGAVDPIFVEDAAELRTILHGVIQHGDIVLTQGAGNIGKIAKQLAEEIVECVV
ncbi:MAG TPA: UDP-N-acetylmuramate--L-alanine ligase [Gammaproteobacteria bacterium]|nr:UDP-N-acetylmuramate--L-alanine ligase [Gammaproteobacteria bacterium]